MSLVKRAVIDAERCVKRETCEAMLVCPAGAIVREDEEEAPYVDTNCVGCGKCVKVCPHQAISLV